MDLFELLTETYRNFDRHRASFLAATISYFAFLSLFPLLLFVISLLGFFLESGRVQREVFSYVSGALPVSAEFIRKTLVAIIKQREGVGLIGLVGLLWTGTNIFSALEYALNTIWSVPTPRHFLKHKLLAFLLVLAGALLVSISLVATSLSSSVKGLVSSFVPAIAAPLLATAATVLVALAISIVVFFMAYFIVPNVYQGWRDVWLGAVVGGLFWEIGKYVFGWYLSSLAHYQAIYGTLGAVVALLIWIYASSMILLWGAELNLAYQKLRPAGQPTP